MDQETIRFMAAQLRKPNGEAARDIGEKMNEGNKLMNLAAIRMLDLKPGERILEVGMGNGFFVKNLFETEEKIHYTGCDFSEEMVTEAKQRNAGFISQEKAVFHLSNAENLPLQDNTADKIFTVNTIYFWENPTVIFSEFHRVLKENGELIIAVRPKSIMEKFPVTRHGFNMFSRTELETILLKHQFTPLSYHEEREADLEVFGEKLDNGFLIVRATR